MRIAVMGTGGTGGYFGGLLAQSGEDVTFIARGENLKALQTNGLRVESMHGDFTIQPVKATDDPASIGPVDAVLFATKTWQIEDAAALIRPLLGPETMILPTLNGVDVEPLVRLANGETVRHEYETVELDRMLSVVRKLRRIQEVVLAVNQEYIASAASGGEFLLQGSYRNMNRMAARIVPAMNDDEVEALIDDHYLGEAQLLGTRAEANLARLRELKG